MSDTSISSVSHRLHITDKKVELHKYNNNNVSMGVEVNNRDDAEKALKNGPTAIEGQRNIKTPRYLSEV